MDNRIDGIDNLRLMQEGLRLGADQVLHDRLRGVVNHRLQNWSRRHSSPDYRGLSLCWLSGGFK